MRLVHGQQAVQLLILDFFRQSRRERKAHKRDPTPSIDLQKEKIAPQTRYAILGTRQIRSITSRLQLKAHFVMEFHLLCDRCFVSVHLSPLDTLTLVPTHAEGRSQLLGAEGVPEAVEALTRPSSFLCGLTAGCDPAAIRILESERICILPPYRGTSWCYVAEQNSRHRCAGTLRYNAT